MTIARIIAGLRELGDHAKGSGVSVIVESHGEFTRAPLLLEIIKGADHPNVAFLWDTHHTFVAGEAPDVTIGQLKGYLRHAHLKDSVKDARNFFGYWFRQVQSMMCGIAAGLFNGEVFHGHGHRGRPVCLIRSGKSIHQLRGHAMWETCSLGFGGISS